MFHMDDEDVKDRDATISYTVVLDSPEGSPVLKRANANAHEALIRLSRRDSFATSSASPFYASFHAPIPDPEDQFPMSIAPSSSFSPRGNGGRQ